MESIVLRFALHASTFAAAISFSIVVIKVYVTLIRATFFLLLLCNQQMCMEIDTFEYMGHFI